MKSNKSKEKAKEEKIRKKRPERERTEEADWMPDLTWSQLKKDSIGCRQEATEELKQSPESSVSRGFFFLGVIS